MDIRESNKRGPLIAIPGVVARPPRHLGRNMFCGTILQGNFPPRREVNSEVDWNSWYICESINGKYGQWTASRITSQVGKLLMKSSCEPLSAPLSL